MRLLATLSILSSVLALAAASAGSTKAEAEALKLADSVLHPVVEVREAEPETSMLEVRKPKELQGRACIENGCTCKKVKRGQVRNLPGYSCSRVSNATNLLVFSTAAPANRSSPTARTATSSTSSSATRKADAAATVLRMIASPTRRPSSTARARCFTMNNGFHCEERVEV